MVGVHASKMPSINKFLPLDEDSPVSNRSKENYLNAYKEYLEAKKKKQNV